MGLVRQGVRLFLTTQYRRWQTKMIKHVPSRQKVDHTSLELYEKKEREKEEKREKRRRKQGEARRGKASH